MDAYRLTSLVYDAVIEPVNVPLRAVARRVCPPDPAWRVLDVGCGTGTALAEYRALGCEVIGVDQSAAMLDKARQRLGPDADLRLAPEGLLPVADATADLVLLSLVLHSLPHEEASGLLDEVARVLAPGGRVLVTDFGTTGLRFPKGYLSRVLAAAAELGAGPDHARNCWAYLRGGGVAGLLASRSGLRQVRARPTSGGNITIAVLEGR